MKNKPTHISAFDLDHTLFRVNTSFSFFSHLVKKRFYSKLHFFPAIYNYIRHHFFGLSIDKLHHTVFKNHLYHKSLQSLKAHAETFLSDDLFPHLYQPAYRRLKEAQQKGHYTLILSNSPEFLVQPIANKLGVKHCGGTTYDITPSGKLEAISELMMAKKKAEVIKKVREEFNLEKSDVTAYSDSYHDLLFLEEASHPVAVQPDKRLKKYAKIHNWEII